MTRLLHLVLEIEDESFDEDDMMGELIDILTDHAKTGTLVDLKTGESDKAIYLDRTGDYIPCYVRKVGYETVLD